MVTGVTSFIRAIRVIKYRPFEDEARSKAGLLAAARAEIELGEPVVSAYGLQGEGWYTEGEYCSGPQALWCADGELMLLVCYVDSEGQSHWARWHLDASKADQDDMLVMPANYWHAVLLPLRPRSRLEVFRPARLVKDMSSVTDRWPPGFDPKRVIKDE
jgi:hypothetical protein